MKLLSQIKKLVTLGKSESPVQENVTDDLSQDKGRLKPIRKLLSQQSQESGAGITYSELILRNAKIVKSNILLAAVVAAVVVKVMFFSDPITIITPPNMTEEIKLIGNKTSESYKTQWALFFSTMVGNINPKNINFVTDYITEALSPELQAKTSEELQNQATLMATRGVDQSFSPNDIYYDPKNDVVYVWGNKTTRLINVPDKVESSRWTYEWVLGMKNGRPRIAYVKQYAGTPNIKKVTINGKEQLAKLDDAPVQAGGN
ncbi:TraE/TraK family type IV conjugative transfer system protein [Photorhabdus heterorhabditis]|uniref:Pilus assembly protein n=2 Tax=Photorhabdus heterorhabditis TaxID=880156 RepID=A0A5B0WHW7_9GAMM|nr:TraE/TraK family type IV conjugative transfer system protein [Photorhabdus heterorhabditis]KAA1186416.1 pilus assembly protein [Photorhabdus heterorhabditis]KOY62811.1 pilus assembly protein [Photorhabdus heterorhabditis]MBS9441183.1 pilus assembly protein [Photorhabdus heterorhabditis]NRN28997.1 pilus assembly protein [Photorhabdus heterorhabditis subsp. aluminescens]